MCKSRESLKINIFIYIQTKLFKLVNFDYYFSFTIVLLNVGNVLDWLKLDMLH